MKQQGLEKLRTAETAQLRHIAKHVIAVREKQNI